ncbi:MAG: type II toxin-antitoxin system HicB family antitoxin [Ktedonobacteraceae bacterium]|nr:type II toxin-antitoxin system HicB family antitoxin [Ktedonobacteraceae bacterium]
MIPNSKHYSMVIQWSNEDQAYIVMVPELPGCMTHGNSYEEAVKQGQDAIESWLQVAQELGRPIPAPQVAA